MERITTNLQMIKEFRLIERTSVEQYRNNKTKSTPEIAKELGDLQEAWQIYLSEAARDKIWKPDNTYTDMDQKAIDNMKPVLDEYTKLGTFTDRYTDWIVQ
jgi:hypothetical protein